VSTLKSVHPTSIAVKHALFSSADLSTDKLFHHRMRNNN